MNEVEKQVALIQANAHNFKQPARAVEDNKNPKELASIDEIFTRLKAIGSVGNAFKTPQEEAIVKQEWMLAMREEGITKQSMIDDGIESFRVKARKSRSTAWFPSIGEFIDMCLGSEDVTQFAKRALSLFNRAQRQIDSIGQMVVKNHSFELKRLTADKTEKQFIELYLSYAQDNAIQMLDAFAITETVQLSEEQLKDKQRRIQTAQNEHLSKMNSLFGKPAAKIVEKEVNSVGVKTGSLKVYNKSPRQLEEEKLRQLEMIKGKLK